MLRSPIRVLLHQTVYFFLESVYKIDQRVYKFNNVMVPNPITMTKEDETMSHNNGNSLLPLIGAATLGFAGGFIAGIIMAPKSGYELRKEVSDKTEDVKHKAEEVVDQMSESFYKAKESIKHAARAEKDEEIIYYDDEDEQIFTKDFKEDDTVRIIEKADEMEDLKQR